MQSEHETQFGRITVARSDGGGYDASADVAGGAVAVTGQATPQEAIGRLVMAEPSLVSAASEPAYEGYINQPTAAIARMLANDRSHILNATEIAGNFSGVAATDALSSYVALVLHTPIDDAARRTSGTPYERLQMVREMVDWALSQVNWAEIVDEFKTVAAEQRADGREHADGNA